MRIEIDHSLFPLGTTEKDVLAALADALSVSIGEAYGEESLLEKALYETLKPPPTPAQRARTTVRTTMQQMNSRDLTYLRLVSNTRNGHNDYMQGWRQAESTRTKLKGLGLVTVKSYKEAGMGDVDSTVCEITPAGRALLKEAHSL